MIETYIGLGAAVATTAANLPQALKAWRTRSTGDLSLRMLVLLLAGLCAWVAYGYLQGDGVIMIANSVSAALLAYVLSVKLREG